MSKFLFTFLYIASLVNSFNINNNIIDSTIENDSFYIKSGISLTHFVKYKKNTEFIFNITSQDQLQINIHSINCNINVDSNGQLLKQINLNTYSFILDSNHNSTIITPVIDVIDGVYKENYEQKDCPLSINSFLVNKEIPKLKIENKEDNILYLSHENPNSNSLLISYEINNITLDSFIALYFQFNEKNNFSVFYTYQKRGIQVRSFTHYFDEPKNIYLNSDNLFYEVNDTNAGINLFFVLENIDKKPLVMYFKIIEKDTVSIIEKNFLSFGFITSQLSHQYYYTEVLSGEEGEFMLHNKRCYGVLYAKIIDKSGISLEELKNPLIYPNETLNENISSYLTYNPHGLHLNYSYENTSHCINGCYLLITYEQKKSEGNHTLIGYEFTILFRSWNFTDYNPHIVDIPFNEYIIGAFHKGSITHHYYSFTVPDDTEKIIIQIEGNYLDGFYGEGRKKLNTEKIIGKMGKLDIISNKNVLTLNKTELNYTGNIMSFAFRPKVSYADVFSFYYFRILCLQKDEKLYFPIDSQFGNLCIPEYDINKDKYYCNLVFYNNNYNELSRRFAISSSMQNEYFKIYSTKVYTDGSSSTEDNEFIYYCNDNDNDLAYYLFQFEFPNDELKNIITCFFDNVTEIHPQIYSSQMFYLYDTPKTGYFNLKNNYIFNYIHVYGNGNFLVNFLNIEKFYSNRNFKGKPTALPIESKSENIVFNSSKKKDFIFYFQLLYSMKNKGVEEIISGETKSQFVKGGYFPLYYYLKIKDKEYINLDVNLRLNSYNETLLQNDFDIKGYLLDEESITRKINGEYIKLTDAIQGNYSDIFKVGLLQVNQPLNEGFNYFLIEIISNNQRYINSYLLVELVTKEYNDNVYFLPINKYILETFDGKNNEIRKENKYYVTSKYKDKWTDCFIEISTAFDDIQIEFGNKTNDIYEFDCYFGFRKYWVRPLYDYNIYFKVINPKSRDTNYMIRYFYTGRGGEFIYSLDMKPERKDISINQENITISLTFNAINIKYKNASVKEKVYPGIYFNIYGFLYNLEKNSDEKLNTTSFLQEQKHSYANKTVHFYNETYPKKWTIIFENISRIKNYNYDLQLQVNSIIPTQIFNEELLIFTTKIDLTDIKEKEAFPFWWIIIGIVGAIILIIVILFIIKYKRLQRSKKNLEEEMKSFAYSNNIQRNLINKEKKAQKDEDYDTTFI